MSLQADKSLLPRQKLLPAPPRPTQVSRGRRAGAFRAMARFGLFLLARPGDVSADAALVTRLGLSCEAELRSGLRVLLIAAAVVGLWGGLAPLSGAVVLPGALVSESSVRKVQHPSGGVVAQIAAYDGETVKAGDLLARLDDTATRANRQVVVGALDAIRARVARLAAERDDAPDMPTPEKLASRMNDKEVAAIVAAEKSLFKARRVSRNGQRELLTGRIGQLEEEIRGLDAQMKSQGAQRDLIASEENGVQQLYQKQLVPLARLTALQREAARLDGAQGQLVSSTAETRSKIDEARLQVARLDQDFRAEVMKDLRESQDKEAELAEKAVTAQDLLDRVEIRAPVTGVVHQLAVHTIGGVVLPGEVLMEIVPEKDELRVEAHLPPHDIDQARVGQKAQVRFSAFNQRTTPAIEGQVVFISPDTTQDAKSGTTYYRVRVALSPDEVGRLGGLQLVPGMPSEVFLQTGSRTMLSYLFKPISDQLSRVFRER
jgi:HlyD family secretion protein